MYSAIEKMTARRLYVEAGYTFARIALKTRISTSQLKSWSKSERWREVRKDLEAAAKVGDSVTVYRIKSREDRVIRQLSSINRRQKRCQLGNEPESTPDLTPDDLTSKRQAAGLSQRELAERLGINEKSLSKMEQGYRRITKWMTIAILAVLSAAKPSAKVSNGG